MFIYPSIMETFLVRKGGSGPRRGEGKQTPQVAMPTLVVGGPASCETEHTVTGETKVGGKERSMELLLCACQVAPGSFQANFTHQRVGAGLDGEPSGHCSVLRKGEERRDGTHAWKAVCDKLEAELPPLIDVAAFQTHTL